MGRGARSGTDRSALPGSSCVGQLDGSTDDDVTRRLALRAHLARQIIGRYRWSAAAAAKGDPSLSDAKNLHDNIDGVTREIIAQFDELPAGVAI